MLKATDVREMFGEHDWGERVARAAAESNSSASRAQYTHS